MKIKVASSYSGKISTGSYENASPFFSAEVEFDTDKHPEHQGFLTDMTGNITKMHRELQEICYGNFKAAEQKAIVERIQKERQDFRWYKDDKGADLPSATSIIGFDSDWSISPLELQQYASQSQICHAQVAHFIETGKWVTPDKLGEIWTDLVIVTKGSLGLETEGWDFPAFLEKYPIEKRVNGKSLINLKHRYGGTPDFYGIPNFKEAKKIDTIFDVKRTADKVKNFMQMAAYAKCPGNEKIKQMVIVVLNNKTEQGFSKPIVSTEIDKYFDMFLRKREEFRKRYGV